ncbi:acetyltransferase [Teratosphaeria destructans]|uniref:Acetyltransferase n=1 Tax=Teratosphaeria destructans TaxID=418781 RepID=A0A9W7SKB4_9PEZI|nr:acetyltransferase [Teratosphaeria destructans]
MINPKTNGQFNSKSQYDILEATPDDVPALVKCADRAFANDALHSRLWNHGEASPEILAWRMKKYSEHFQYPHKVIVKAVPKGDRKQKAASKADETYLEGIDTALLRSIDKEADKDGLPAYLEATPAGQLFYPLYGFEPTGKQVERFEGEYVNKAMFRPATKVVADFQGGEVEQGIGAAARA